jgi:hypothetical protein
MEEPKLINDWEELEKCVSETHHIELDDEHRCSGWIYSKETGEWVEYLSTHTFYGSTYEGATKVLQKYGFNVQLANWDEL